MIKVERIDAEFIEAVEDGVGMGHGAWDMVDPREIVAAVLAAPQVRESVIAADSELSAIAHGRPPSVKEELLSISHRLRRLYE